MMDRVRRDLGKISALGGFSAGLNEILTAQSARGLFFSSVAIVLGALLTVAELEEVVARHGSADAKRRLGNFVEDFALYSSFVRAACSFVAAMCLATRAGLFVGAVVVLMVAQSLNLVFASELVAQSVRSAQGYLPKKSVRFGDAAAPGAFAAAAHDHDHDVVGDAAGVVETKDDGSTITI
ncbi:hypothetical protein JL721_4825 [Aureococcus anophagefferens]|nr:hypothetical protein JL721_4825 [Aureococcus anophagefferens]